MSGRWRGREESPPRSPSTDELGRGCGLGPAPRAPDPPWSLGLWSLSPARILEPGTRPALSHPLLERGAAAPGQARAKAGSRAPESRAPGSPVPVTRALSCGCLRAAPSGCSTAL